jgi:hypothetical protein
MIKGETLSHYIRKKEGGACKHFILAFCPHHFTTVVSRLGWHLLKDS